MTIRAVLAGAFCMVLAGGCVERTLTINTSPSGALVYLNDQEIGRTPVTRDFTWYGNYDLALRKEGYQTVKTTQNVKAPWFQIVPLDLFAELSPFHFKDLQSFSYTMEPVQAADPRALLERGEEMKGKLAGSRRATTRPAAGSATGPGKATTQSSSGQ